jgi:hypothetical protein
VALAVAPPVVQVMVTGQLPVVVREPTVQLQPTAPSVPDVVGPSPDAFDGPDL